MINGYIDEADNFSVKGWVWDDERPELQLTVHIAINGNEISNTTANNYRQDLKDAKKGDGKFGFYLEYLQPLDTAYDHVVEVYIKTTDNDGLFPQYEDSYLWRCRRNIARLHLPQEVTVTNINGNIDFVSVSKVVGWACNFDDISKPVVVTIQLNKGEAYRVLANKSRRDLEEAKIGIGRHGFEFNYPHPLSPFESNEISVRIENTTIEVPGSPAILGRSTSNDSNIKSFLSYHCRHVNTAEDVGAWLELLSEELIHLIFKRAKLDAREDDRIAFKNFVMRWQRRLPDAEKLLLENAHPKQTQRVLVIDKELPDPNRDAGSNAIVSHMLSLKRLGYEVAFAASDEMYAAKERSIKLISEGITVLSAPFYLTIEEILVNQSNNFDVIYIHRVTNAIKYVYMIRSNCPSAHIVFSVADLHHIRLMRQGIYEQNHQMITMSQRFKFQEMLCAAAADTVITHSIYEREQLLKTFPPEKVHVVPWVINKTCFNIDSDVRGVGFMGFFGHAPNLDAAERLIQEIMPFLHQLDQTIICKIAGSHMPEYLFNYKSPTIELLGFVDTLDKFFSKIRVSIAPMQYGAGIKGKVLESLARGIPCVCTPIASEGLNLPPSLSSIVSEDNKDLANSVFRLHTDPEFYQLCRTEGFELIEEVYSQKTVDIHLANAIAHSKRIHNFIR